MGDLPNLPPGWSWEATDGIIKSASTDEDYAQVAGETLAEVVDRANTFHDWYLRAAITDAATAAGVVLSKGFDAGAVLRDGVRAHGWWWEGRDDGGVHLVIDGDDMGFARPAGGPSGSGWVYRGILTHLERAPAREAAAIALWAAVGPEGLPMPPLPEAPCSE